MLFTFRIFEQLRLPWNTGGALNSLYWMCFFIIQDFWATCACPEIFRCTGYIFYYSGVLSNLRLLWKQSCPGIFTVLNMLFTFRIFEQLALALKTELPWNFSLYWNIFYYSGLLRNLRFPWKESLPWNFSSPGGRPPPRLVRLWSVTWTWVLWK